MELFSFTKKSQVVYSLGFMKIYTVLKWENIWSEKCLDVHAKSMKIVKPYPQCFSIGIQLFTLTFWFCTSECKFCYSRNGWKYSTKNRNRFCIFTWR